LLDLADRRVPEPLPTTGQLELHRLTEPSIPYALDWSAIARIDLYEQMLLTEANRLTNTGEFGEAFEYLAFLQQNYPRLEGLPAALDEHLWRDASASFAAGRGDQAWPALLALYDRNPDYPRLAGAVQAVTDSLMTRRLEAGDYGGARAVLDLAERRFSTLELSNLATWRARFASDASKQLEIARRALAERRYDAARAAAMMADSIEPNLEEARQLLREIQAAAPEMRIAVTQMAGAPRPGRLPQWAQARVELLLRPPLVGMTDFGAEGGVYGSPFVDVATDDAGLETTLHLLESSRQRGLSVDAIARRLSAMVSPDQQEQDRAFAAALDDFSVARGADLHIAWRQPPLHPGALLQIPLPQLTTSEASPGLWFQLREPSGAEAQGASAVYERTGPAGGAPRTIVERIYANDEEALAALLRGDVDAIDRVPPWQLDRLRQAPGVVVGAYRLPTVHVLIPNLDNPLLASREFRRALCYATDREGIVADILLAGGAIPGFRAISGPFPAGTSLNDPAGYGYNASLPLRPYEPRLAALLAGVARTTLAKRDLEQRKARGEPLPAADPAAEPSVPPPAPLVLAHPADPLARVACQSLKLQLDRVGIPIRLEELPADGSASGVAHDLLYAELAVREPLVDARRLLSSQGVAGRSGALMTAALDELDRAQNWNDARRRLREVHRIAYYDLPLVPLWQTANFFAHRTWLQGVGEEPLALYQHIDAWRKEFDE
ncbi:MAG TPA: ABC transporter substrate-binding protein, partial [Lacipirellulaceae bacterium]|nr:ABC transporter substrate-binding protein [Lacipirellulaceae bacterium]